MIRTRPDPTRASPRLVRPLPVVADVWPPAASQAFWSTVHTGEVLTDVADEKELSIL